VAFYWPSPPLDDPHSHPAIDGDRFTRYKFISDEKHDGIRYVLSGSLAMQRNSIFKIIGYLLGAEAVLKRSSDYARRYCIYAYIEIRKFSGYRARELRDCAFHNAIRGRAFATAQSGRR
jgi:hypothetical protein